MLLIAFFTDNGVPKTGLSPTIDVWESDATQVVTAQAMTEVAGGFYKYDFSAYDESKDYCIRVDGGASLSNFDRYKYNTNTIGQVTEDLTDVLADTNEIQSKLPTNNIMGSSVKTDKDDEIDAIKAKTDNLPSDPASTTDIITHDTSIDSQLASIQLDLDNPDQYKADISGLSTSSDMAYLLKIIKNKKILQKNGSTWELIIYDDDDSTPILNKEIKDKDGNEITDLAAGTLAQELKTSV